MVISRVIRLLRKDELVVDVQADYDRDVIERRHSDSRRLIGGEGYRQIRSWKRRLQHDEVGEKLQQSRP